MSQTQLKTAIVTGASSGIGKHSAIALSKAGWNVVLTARRLGHLMDTATLCPGPTLVLAANITDENAVEDIFNKTIEAFGRLDLLFNNAGANAKTVPIESMSLETFQSVINVNVIGTFLATRQAIRIFKTQEPRGGRIINNGSISAHTPRPHTVPYTASKHAITGLTKCTALDGRAFNITCTQIDIGNALTDMATMGSGALQPDGNVKPEATFDVEHVASTIVHIASLPPDVAVLEVVIMAARAPYVGRG
ncbi:short-chain dehydrogenase/reductase SDR [Crepidotus variabilis]|uniref:Short-chain dehydrogenase/reductase SDR n=1 Tax=Crepidotus variabilis TaxID=179855 RepID=A0A9P6ER11_9AGAR|nr:short-chain dehydrogenase/reductase SDR [Crepidotus variabilis]